MNPVILDIELLPPEASEIKFGVANKLFGSAGRHMIETIGIFYLSTAPNAAHTLPTRLPSRHRKTTRLLQGERLPVRSRGSCYC